RCAESECHRAKTVRCGQHVEERMRVPIWWLAVSIVIAIPIGSGSIDAQRGTPRGTQVVMLGTGTPLPDPDRAGPSTAIVVNDTPYLIDAGVGVVRRAAAARRKGIAA